MAKKPKQPDVVTVRYDLHELPTAQHKAGLAGLLLQIESMKGRRDRGAELPAPPRVIAQGPSFAEVEFTAVSMQALFDDLYEATIEEAVVNQKWPQKEPKEIRDVQITDRSGKIKIEKRFVYDVVKPTGTFLSRFTDDGKEVWHKLWRDMLWSVTRGKPTTRGPFNARAERKPTKDGAEAWDNLVANETLKAKGSYKSAEVAGAILLGAQACSAESIHFADRADHVILLHFWQITARVFVPEEISADESAVRGDLKWKRSFRGFLLAIPAIVDLNQFCQRYTDSLHFLDPTKLFYYPAAAVVSLPSEAAVEFLNQITTLAATEGLAEAKSTVSVNGIEFFHYEKGGNNTKLLAHGRVNPNRKLQRIIAGIRRQYRSPLFRHHRIRAALAKQPWYADFDEPISEREAELFICPPFANGTVARSNAVDVAAAFVLDCYSRFQQIRALVEYSKELAMDAHDPAEAVDDAVFAIVRQYVHRRTLKRMNLKESAKLDDWKPVERQSGKRRESNKYREERSKLCEQAFLEFRSRQGDDFVRRFAEEMGPFGVRLAKEYRLVARALLSRDNTAGAEADEGRTRSRDDIRVLTLLALSANSRSITNSSFGTGAPQPAGDGKEVSHG